MYLGNIVGPMFSLGDFITMSNQASASSDRISNVLNEKIDLPDGEKELNSLWDKTIEFRNFSFKYPSFKKRFIKRNKSNHRARTNPGSSWKSWIWKDNIFKTNIKILQTKRRRAFYRF